MTKTEKEIAHKMELLHGLFDRDGEFLPGAMVCYSENAKKLVALDHQYREGRISVGGYEKQVGGVIDGVRITIDEFREEQRRRRSLKSQHR